MAKLEPDLCNFKNFGDESVLGESIWSSGPDFYEYKFH